MTYAAHAHKFTGVTLTTPLAQLADYILEGTLEPKLRAWRASGMSWDTIAKELWAETDKKVSITGPGVQAWARQLGIEDPQPSDAA